MRAAAEPEDLSEVEERDSSEDLRRSGGTRGEDVEDLRREKEEWTCCCGEVGGSRGARYGLESVGKE
jgi:hypothetical protein